MICRSVGVGARAGQTEAIHLQQQPLHYDENDAQSFHAEVVKAPKTAWTDSESQHGATYTGEEVQLQSEFDLWH